MRKSSGSSDIYASPQRQLCADGSLPDGAGECHNLPPPGGGCGTCEKGYVKDPDNYCVRDPKTPTPQPTNPCDQNPMLLAATNKLSQHKLDHQHLFHLHI